MGNPESLGTPPWRSLDPAFALGRWTHPNHPPSCVIGDIRLKHTSLAASVMQTVNPKHREGAKPVCMALVAMGSTGK